MSAFSHSRGDHRDLIRDLVRSGWIYTPGRKGNHGKLRSPQGRLVVIANSASDHRALKNTVSIIRRIQRIEGNDQ
ncbi:hypothetical protein [Micromonospora sp. NPDC049891]|uniref:hypothetical protein n=1 Tax=Micromonospora sp. NPDC049891 TaxID=3155655 RepID=UPI0033D018C7